MVEATDFLHLKIPLNCLLTILSNFQLFAKIRFNDLSDNNSNIRTNANNSNETKKENYLKLCKNNYDENNLNLFKKEKNIFRVENNPNTNFSSDNYYYTSNEQFSVIELNKKQNDFLAFFDLFFDNFTNKIKELIKDEALYYDFNDRFCDENKRSDNNVFTKPYALSDNYMKIISNNIPNNFNNRNNKSSKAITKYKYFLYEETNKSNFSSAIKNDFENYVSSLKANKCCFDNISDYRKEKTLKSFKDIFIIFKSEKNLKRFFIEFINNDKNNEKEVNKDLNNLNKNAKTDYDTNNILSTEQNNISNIDFSRVYS